jgi:hypothetical protein
VILPGESILERLAMLISLLRFVLIATLAITVWPYLLGRMQGPAKPHRRHQVAYQINLAWWRYELWHLNLVESDVC